MTESKQEDTMAFPEIVKQVSREKVAAIEALLAKAHTQFTTWVQFGIGSVSVRPWVKAYPMVPPHVSESNLRTYLRGLPDDREKDYAIGWFGTGADEFMWVCYTPATAHGMLAQAQCDKRKYDDITLVLDTDDSMPKAEQAELEEQRAALRESCDTLFTWGWRMLKAERMRS